MTRFTGKVVLITGASSGIGRSTAHAFARRGALLVLAARGESGLRAAAEECRRLGAEVLVVPTDVTDEAQVHALVAAAVERFGRLDVVVGNAGVAMAGALEDLPTAMFRRVIDTNVFGHVHLLHAVLPRFRAAGRGTYIAVASIESRLSAPYQSAYVTSKHALLGLVDSVRDELAGSGVTLSTVLPATVDTPIYATSANRTGRVWHPMPPAIGPRRVARAIVRVAAHPRRTTYVGVLQSLLVPFELLVPSIAHPLTRFAMGHIALRGRAEPTEGNLFEPDEARAAVDGGALAAVRRRTGVVALLVGATSVVMLLGRRRG